MIREYTIADTIIGFCFMMVISWTANAQNSVGNILTGDAKLEVLRRYSGPKIASRPRCVLIQDFTTTGAVVTEDKHHPLPQGPQALLKQVQDSFASTLLAQFKKANIDAHRVSDASAVVGPALAIQGEFVTVDAGNSRKRILLGFGRGASDVKTHVIISFVQNHKRTVLLDCNINAQSSKKPGAILSTSGEGFALGVLLGHFGDKRSSTVQADASRMAKLVGKQSEAVMLAQGWILAHRPPIVNHASS
jgi:hypothetical protein